MVSRRHALGLIGTATAVVGSGCLFGSSTSEEQPTPVSNRTVDVRGSILQYQHDSENSGTLAETVPSAPTVAWRRTPNRYNAAQPVVDGERGYVTFDGNVVAFSLVDGEPEWIVDAGHASRAAPAVHDDVVYQTVWNGGDGVPRGVVAINADGSERWRALTNNDITTAPTPTDDAIFVGGGYETTEVAAVDHDGSVRWRHDLGEYATAPAVADDRVVYASGEAASVVALDTATGDRQWEQSVDGPASAAPTVAGESVIVGDEAGTVRALSIDTGEEQWRVTVGRRIQQSVAVADTTDSGVVAVAHHGGVTLLSVDGYEQWSVDLSREPTAPVLTETAVLLGTGRAVVALARTDGTERWRFETRERNYTDVVLRGVTGSPVAVDETVFVATQAGDIYALNDA